VVILEGGRIILRPLSKRDINKRYLSWLNDKEVTRYMETGRVRVTMKDLWQFYNRIRRSDKDIIFAICDKKNKFHIGNIKLGGINHFHRFCDIGIMIGDKEYWGKRYCQEACGRVLSYAFNTLGLNKVMLGVYAPHKAAIEAYKKSGFRTEGRLKRTLLLDGKYVDKVIMGMTRSDFTKRKKEKQ